MIGLLQGVLYYKSESNIIIMVNGVGYKVEGVSALVKHHEGDTILAYIYTHVREDAIKLFGFATEEELKIFEMLISVSGVGPKGAMSIISTLGVTNIYQAVIHEDPKVFKSVSGIGMKNAEKIVIELKSKVRKDGKEEEGEPGGISYQTKEELEAALLALGYSMAEIKNVESKIDYSGNVTDMVKVALKLLNRI